VQLAAKIRERLGIGRVGPQRTRDPLARYGRMSRVKKKEGDELLLARGWRPRTGSAVDENTKPSKQLNPQDG
jgi:hypothetical protein